MTTEEKEILQKEIKKYIKQNCYYRDGSLKYYDLWLVGWVAGELVDRKNALKVLINNEYGLLGNLLYKHVRTPDDEITQLIECTDLKVILDAVRYAGSSVISRNEMDIDAYAMRLLISHDKKYSKYVDYKLANNKSFLLSIADCCPEMLAEANQQIFDDEEFSHSLVKRNYQCLRYLPSKYHSDYQISAEAIKQEGFSLMYLNLDTRNSYELVLSAVSNRGNSLSMAPAEYKKDRRIVEAAVRNCGLALEYADEKFKRDRDIVLMAVEKHGMALRSVAPALQDDDSVVMKAVKNDGYAIRFASERLKDNKEMALLAVTAFPGAYKYLSSRLQADPDIVHIFKQKKEEENSWLQLRKQ